MVVMHLMKQRQNSSEKDEEPVLSVVGNIRYGNPPPPPPIKKSKEGGEWARQSDVRVVVKVWVRVCRISVASE